MSGKPEDNHKPAESPNQRTSLTAYLAENYQTLHEDGIEEELLTEHTFNVEEEAEYLVEEAQHLEEEARYLEDTRRGRLEKIKLQGYYNVDDAIEYIGIGVYHYLWMVLYGFTSMVQGVETTLNSLILSEQICYWNLQLYQVLLIPALTLLAAVPGDYLGGFLADRFGRKRVLYVGQLIIAVFGTASAFCDTYPSYLGVRCVVGFGIGLVVMLVIVQIAEVSPAASRLTAVLVAFAMWAVGNFYIVIGAWLFEEPYGWHAVVLWAAAPCIALCFIIPFCDESPKYLVISDQIDNAKEVLSKIAGYNNVPMCPGELRATEETQRGQVKDMFTPEFLRTSTALLITGFMSNFLYMGNVYDTPFLLNSAYCDQETFPLFNFNSTSSASCVLTTQDFINTMVVCGGEVLSIPLVWLLSEFLGRIRASQIMSFNLLLPIIFCCFCLGKIALVIELFLTRTLSNAVIILIWIFTPESFPTYMRSIAFGTVIMSMNLGGIFGLVAVYYVGDYISWTYMFCAFIVAAAVLFVATFFYENETVGVRLSDNRLAPGTVEEMVEEASK